ncbi:MAG TPA: SusC/RagA family TonB-linked outer membrane protein, partial [Puia sp.]|nr:SusC/RagA family TonB-linked outer membrane protein [Puia sp.]
MAKKRNSFSKALCFFVLLLTGTGLFAQRQITGKITDRLSNQPVPGASIKVKGTTNGVQSGNDGSFSISVSTPNPVLVITSVGFETQEVNVGNENHLAITMVLATSGLNEVVVTGYSSQRKKDITGSVSVVKVSDLQSTPASDATTQLQGRAAGVVVVNDNVPGNTAKVRIRGYASFTGNDPLYIIDGVPGDLSIINPNDIESMQVLKDAASASVYGARASNGVIIVTTKKGKQGPAKVSYDFYYGNQNPGNGYSNLLDPQENANLIWLALKNSGQPTSNGQYGSGATPVLPDYILAGTKSGVMNGDPAADPALYDLSQAKLADPSYTPYLIVPAAKQGTNWFKAMTRNAPIMNHNLTVSGGSDRNKYLFGLSYFNQDAILINSFYKRYTARANTEFNIKKVIRIGENLQLTASETNGPPNGNNFESSLLTLAYQEQPIIPVYNLGGDFGGSKGANLGSFRNPIALSERQKNNRTTNFYLFGNMYAEVDFLKHFTARSSFGGGNYTGNTYSYPYIEYENSENTRNITYSEGYAKSTEWTWTNLLTYKNNIGLHDLSVLVGSEAINSSGRSMSGSRSDYFTYTNLNYIVLNSGAGTQLVNGSPFTPASLYSLFGKLDYAYNSRYLASFTLRRDGSSRFGNDNRYAIFPSVSLGWRISEENFMRNITWINDLKIRGSYGKMGNQRIPPANQFTQFGSSQGTSFYDITGSNSSSQSGFFLSFIGNSAGKWETNETTNIGFDATLFGGNTEVVLDVYNKKTNDLLYPVEQPATAGGTASGNPPFFNVGSMKNRGLDLAITQRGYIGGHRGVKFDATLNLTTYKNEITSIAEGVEYFDYNSPLNEANRVGGAFTRNA